MTLPVLTAVTGAWEAPLVAALEGRGGGSLRVVRRCADLGEVLAAAAAGLGRAVLLSEDLDHLDREALARLAEAGVAVVGLATPGDVAAHQRLERLGVRHTLPADADPADVARAVTGAVEDLDSTAAGAVQTDGDLGSGPGHPGPAGRGAPGRLVAVWGPVGAPGRTTVAVTLAAELARLSGAALIADADTYGPSLAQTLGLLEESSGLAAAVRAANGGGLDLERLNRLAPHVGGGLRVLTGLPRPHRWAELRPSGLEVVWDGVRDLAPWTVVDTGFGLECDEEITFDTAAPRRNGATLSALGAADVVVVVGAAEPVGLQRLVRGLEDLAAVRDPSRPRRVVVTRVRPGAVGPSPARRVTDALARFAGVRDAVLVPDDRAACDAAMLAGRTLVEVAPSSAATAAIAALAAWLEASLPATAPTMSR
jgi:MinD-like ATPase involved in chromosome partitioning or flagellar assembly